MNYEVLSRAKSREKLRSYRSGTAWTHREVLAYSPTLADKVAIVTTDQSATDVALQVLMVVRPDLYEAHPRAELVRIANGEAMAELQESIEDLKAELAEFQCPICGSPLVETARVNHEYGDDLVQIFECGRGYNSLCPSDPRFPNLSEYDLVTNYYPENEPYAWQCWGIPMTENARLLSVHGRGKSEEEARIDAIREYAAAARTWPKGTPSPGKADHQGRTGEHEEVNSLLSVEAGTLYTAFIVPFHFLARNRYASVPLMATPLSRCAF